MPSVEDDVEKPQQTKKDIFLLRPLIILSSIPSSGKWNTVEDRSANIPSNFSQCPIDRSKKPENLPLWKIYGGVGEAGKTKKNASPGENFCKRIEQCVFMR